MTHGNYITKLHFFLLFNLVGQSKKGHIGSIYEPRLFKGSAVRNLNPQNLFPFCFHSLLELISEAQFSVSCHPKKSVGDEKRCYNSARSTGKMMETELNVLITRTFFVRELPDGSH